MKPSDNEEKYFQELEVRRRLDRARAEQELMTQAEKNRLKELHFMHCPKCGQRLHSECYGSVEIDVCGSCRGLWLDANELESILASREQVAPWRRMLKAIGAQKS